MQPTNSANWADALDARVRFFIADGRGSIPDEKSRFFTVRKSDREQEFVLLFGDIGEMGAFSGNIDFDTIKQNYKKTITNVEYAKGAAVQYKLWKTQQLPVVDQIARLLGQSSKRRLLVDAYSPFNLGFSTYTTADGAALWSASHTSNVGGSTQSNLGSSALSATAVDATRVLMGKFNTSRDQLQFDTDPDMIWCGLDLEAYAAEIVGSKGKIDTANNNINFHYGRYGVMASRVITDSNNWGMLNMKRMKENQFWFDVVPMETEKDKEFSTKVSRWSVYAFYGHGPAGWDHGYAHAVS